MNNRSIHALHRDANVVLGYVNPWLSYHRGGVSAREYFTRAPSWCEGSVPQMRKGGVDLVVCSHTVNDKSKFPGAAGVEYMLRCFDALINEIDARPDVLLVRTKSDLERATRGKKLGFIFHLTGMPINGSLAVLRSYVRLGVRSAHPFCSDPAIGGAAYGSGRVGLKPFGREILREMERLSILVDLAHANDRTFQSALDVVTKPVIDSHTACRALCDYGDQRSRTDEQLRAIAKTGGVIGVHFSSGVLEFAPARQQADHPTRKLFRRKIAMMERKYTDPYEYLRHRWDPFEWPRSLGGAIEDGTVVRRASIQRLLDHIEHMVDVAGIDHVGLGPDYENGDSVIATASKLPLLTESLARRGFTRTEIRKILGENFLRVFKQSLPSAD